MNYRVFERKLRFKFFGRGYVCLGVINRRFSLLFFADAGRKLVFRVLSYAVGLNLS